MITLMSLTGSHVPLRGTQELAYTTYCISGPDIKNHCRLLELSDALIQVWEERSHQECAQTLSAYILLSHIMTQPISVCVLIFKFF